MSNTVFLFNTKSPFLPHINLKKSALISQDTFPTNQPN